MFVNFMDRSLMFLFTVHFMVRVSCRFFHSFYMFFFLRFNTIEKSYRNPVFIRHGT